MANPYHIIIELPSDMNESAMAGTGTGSTEAESASEWNASANRVAGAVKRMVSFAAVKSTADNIVNREISQVSLKTGATEYEQRLIAGYNAASQVVGAGAALVTGFAAGGPAGAAVVAIGLVASGIQKAISIAYKSEELRNKESLENISIGMQVVRAGVSGRRSQNQ